MASNATLYNLNLKFSLGGGGGGGGRASPLTPLVTYVPYIPLHSIHISACTSIITVQGMCFMDV